MRIVEAVSVGISAIRSNKMRSLLTMLGIIIGVASVLAMIAIGDGAKEIVRQDAQKLGGANQFFVYRMWYKRVNNRWVRNRSSEYLKYEDVLAMEAECPTVRAATPQIWNWGGVLIQASGGSETRAGWNGVDANYNTAMDWNVCGVGGAIGVGLGILAGEGMALLAVKIVKIVPEWPAVVSPQWILISGSVSAIIGISFGLYPALKASSLSPIEALRKD